MARTLAELARLVRGTLVGDGDLEITGAATLTEAAPGEITLLDNADRKHLLNATRASASLAPRGIALPNIAIVQVDDVHVAFAEIVRLFRPPRQSTRVGRSHQAVISPTARLAADVDVYPGASIDDDVEIGPGSVVHGGVHIMAGCRIGRDVTFFPNVVVYDNTLIGDRVIVHAGAVIGAYGFGYKMVDGRHRLSAQLGYVKICDDVEIGACTTIDRGTYGATTVGEGTKIDNQVMIAHNCRLGRHNLICSQVGIAGSTTTGDYVVMAGQAGVRDHVRIGDRAIIGAKAGVHGDVPEGVSMLGYPATPLREQQLMMGAYARLPEIRRKVKELETAVAMLRAQFGSNGHQSAA